MRNILSALLFDKLQRVEFYADVIKDAIELGELPSDVSFIDVGCGPGLGAIHAASLGYEAVGLDTNPKSIAKAKQNAKGQKATFWCKKLEGEKAFTVFAASLIAVFDDREAGLKSLFDGVKEGGTLIIVEPTNAMRCKNTYAYVKKHKPKGAFWLRLWTIARQNNIVDEKIFSTLNCSSIEHTPLMDGLIGVWKIKK